ncbi:MAG TPA: hypothetical protein VE152_02650, partial [Acidimicrobiales bacterium]|nr:hypothetical protein [Acidimicrobiales bacterium]
TLATGDPRATTGPPLATRLATLQARLKREGVSLARASGELRVQTRAADRARAAAALLALGAPAPSRSLPPGLAMPTMVFDAYLTAAGEMGRVDPGCHLSWADLAAIGKIESDNAQYHGTRLAADGTAFPAILGPALDGTGGNGAYLVPANVSWDGSGPFERAVGPMQFLPTTWQALARVLPPLPRGVPPNPNNVYAAALGAGRYLCLAAGPRGMTSLQGIKAAYFSYNHSVSYVGHALRNALAYGAPIVPRPSSADLYPPPGSSPPPLVRPPLLRKTPSGGSPVIAAGPSPPSAGSPSAPGSQGGGGPPLSGPAHPTDPSGPRPSSTTTTTPAGALLPGPLAPTRK